MNTAILSSVIGGSAVLLATVIGVFFAHFLDRVNHRFERIEGEFGVLTAAVQTLDTKFTGAISELDTKFTGAIKDLEIRLSSKFTAQLKEHGERLARIEAKLDIDPPAEAA